MQRPPRDEPGRLTTGQALVGGAIVVGTLDLLDAVTFFGLRGVPAARIFQSTASGLVGRAAYRGGAAAAALGVALHFLIALVVVAVYLLASRRLPALRRRPFVFGPLYRFAVYAVMEGIVIPLLAAVTGAHPLPVVVNGLVIHMLGVGLPSALAARAAPPAERPLVPAALA